MTGKNFLTKREFDRLLKDSPSFDDFLQNVINELIRKWLAFRGDNPPLDTLEEFVNALIENQDVQGLYA